MGQLGERMTTLGESSGGAEAKATLKNVARRELGASAASTALGEELTFRPRNPIHPAYVKFGALDAGSLFWSSHPTYQSGRALRALKLKGSGLCVMGRNRMECLAAR